MRRNRRSKKSNSKILGSFVFIITSFFILLVTLGYSAYSSSLAINGEALVRAESDVRITNAQVAELGSLGRVNSNSSYAVRDFTSDIQLRAIYSSVTFDITVTNLSSSNVLITNVENKAYSNTLIGYEFINMEINKTVIPAASEYTFQLKFVFTNDTIGKLLAASIEVLNEFLNGASSNLKSTLEFTFYKIPQYVYEVSATPEDSLIVLKKGDDVLATGTGYVSKLIDEGTEVTWSVSKDRYYTQSGTETVTGASSKSIELVRKNEYILTVSPTPSDALVSIKKKDGETLVSGIGQQSVTTDDLTELSYTVSKLEYYDKTGNYTLNGSDYTENVSLEMMPWVTGPFVNTDRKQATTKEDTVYHPGYYLIEMWGGKGGEYYRASSKNTGYRGEAGYIYAVVNLDYNQKIYFTLGGNARNGEISGTSRGGANGGGYGAQTYAGGAGGYSAFAIDTTSISADTINSGNVLMIVGGGGGGSGSSLVAGKPGDGGDAGNMNSTSTVISIGTVFHGEDGTLNQAKEGKNGLGGTYVARANSGAGKAGTLLAGGDGTGNGGGGGGGYFGGGGGGGAGTLSSNQAGGGGGGSSLISNKCVFTGLSASTTAKLVGTNPSSSGGAIVITYLGSSY
ncbi:MAG: glycine rich domain-containing protein [bacterium]|nr:glycine rich domain-containing protein [bacterium]